MGAEANAEANAKAYVFLIIFCASLGPGGIAEPPAITLGGSLGWIKRRGRIGKCMKRDNRAYRVWGRLSSRIRGMPAALGVTAQDFHGLSVARIPASSRLARDLIARWMQHPA
jgi:hypothetical protein